MVKRQRQGWWQCALEMQAMKVSALDFIICGQTLPSSKWFPHVVWLFCLRWISVSNDMIQTEEIHMEFNIDSPYFYHIDGTNITIRPFSFQEKLTSFLVKSLMVLCGFSSSSRWLSLWLCCGMSNLFSKYIKMILSWACFCAEASGISSANRRRNHIRSFGMTVLGSKTQFHTGRVSMCRSPGRVCLWQMKWNKNCEVCKGALCPEMLA